VAVAGRVGARGERELARAARRLARSARVVVVARARARALLPRRGRAARARRLVADDDFLRALHHVLFDVHILEGELVCVESGQVFPIEEGRPNMMLDEDLV